MSQTRQKYCANFPHHVIFEIPRGMDLEDKSIVESFAIKYNTMSIYLVNGKEIVIEGEEDENWWKWPIGGWIMDPDRGDSDNEIDPESNSDKSDSENNSEEIIESIRTLFA